MTVALVTGGNRGVGYGIVRRLAADYATSHLGLTTSSPLTILLGSRSLSAGNEARDSILSSLSTSSAGGAGAGEGEGVTITPIQLDISDPSSLHRVASDIRKTYSEGLDVLINNAGIALTGFDGDVVKETMKVNYHATKSACRLLPVREGGRVINVASMAGILKGYGEEVTRRFLEASTEEEVDEIVRLYEEDVRKGQVQVKGWKPAAYSTSKCALIAYTRVLAEEWRGKGSRTSVNACCPGYVNTDMTKGKGVLTLDEGAQTPVHIALSDLKGASGEFWQECRVSKWWQPS